MKLIIPRVTPSNGQLLRMHWRTQRALNKTWAWEVFIAYMQKEPSEQGQAISKKEVTIISCRKKLLDKDNFMGGMKPLLDALTSNKLIVDDSPEWVDWEAFQELDIKNPRTEITIS